MTTHDKDQWSPPWVEKAPEPGTFRSIFKWGARDRFKHPNPGFLRVIAQKLGLAEADFKQPACLGEAIIEDRSAFRLSSEDAAAFSAIVGPDNCFSDT